MRVIDRETNWGDRRVLFIGIARAIRQSRRTMVLHFLVVLSLGLMILVARNRNHVMMSASTLVSSLLGISALTSLVFTYFDASKLYGVRELFGFGVTVREVDFPVAKIVRVTFDRVYADLVFFELAHGGVVCLSSNELPSHFKFRSNVRVRRLLPGSVFSVESFGDERSLDLFLTLKSEDVQLADMPLSGEVLPGHAEDVVARMHSSTSLRTPNG